MENGKLTLRCERFDPTTFGSIIQALCPGLSDKEAVDQVAYLASYLKYPGLNVQTLLVESPYVDRHYIEEFSRYYATSFRPPPSKTARIHVFSEHFDDETLGEILREAIAAQDLESARTRLQGSYVGYFVIRPLAGAPIGRTVLRTYQDKQSRSFRPTQPHRVHLCGLELTVDAVPFQQQELAVGACATTAIWSALASVSRATGRRGPTPYQITESATRHVMNDRPIPAQAGLDLQQVISAVHHAGFAPQVLKAADNHEAFAVALKCYLASGIPVVLILEEAGGYHAVTAVGYRSSDDEEPSQPIVVQDDAAIPFATTGISRVYVHDDRLGPYARMRWEPQAEDLPTLAHIKRPGAAYAYGGERMKVWAAIAPLYPKIRLSARGLLKVVAETYPLIKLLARERREEIRFELRFVLGGAYLAEISTLGIQDTARVQEFVTQTALPRYVGVVRYFVGDGAIGDVVCDTTDIYRDSSKYSSILALVPFVPEYVDQFEEYSSRWIRAPEPA